MKVLLVFAHPERHSLNGARGSLLDYFDRCVAAR